MTADASPRGNANTERWLGLQAADRADSYRRTAHLVAGLQGGDVAHVLDEIVNGARAFLALMS